MSYIASVFAQRALSIAASDQVDASLWRDNFLRDLQIQPGSLEGEGGSIDEALFFEILESIAQACSIGGAIGLRVGASMRCDDYGAFGLAFKSSVDLGGSFQRVARYGQVVTDVANFSIAQGARTSWMTVPAVVSDRIGEVFTTEIALAAATALSREVSGEDFSPYRVSFSHAATGDTALFEDFFRCKVSHAAESNGIEIRNEDLRRLNTLGDAKISAFFDRHLDDELKATADARSLDKRVIALVTPALSEGPPNIEDIAKKLGMSRRTLQRRLASEQCAYVELVDRARRALSTDLIQTSNYSLAEIAFLSGYSDQSTFTRAFRRWVGDTPADFRRRTTNA